MKIVCISDTHGRHDQLSVPPGDVLVHAGDFTESGDLSSLRVFSRVSDGEKIKGNNRLRTLSYKSFFTPMKITRSLALAFALTAGGISAGSAFAHEGHEHGAPAVEYTGKGALVPISDKTDTAWLAKARADYPMTTCSVSGDKFEDGDMGPPREFVYQETDKPDHLVRFCCKDCLKDFNKEPLKYLKIIDDAAAAKAKARM